MQKSVSLSLAISLLLTGCGALHRSGTWAMVSSAHIDTRDEADPSKAYATQLSRTLAAAHVEHKVVTYQYRYRTRLREEAIGTRTAVVYRDETSARDPWWIMDDRLRRPVWLPGRDLNKQVSFYIRDEAEVVETNGVPAADRGKAQLALTPPVREFETGIARLEPLRKTDRSRPLFAHTPMNKVLPPVAESFDAVFRSAHHCAFDPASPVDRRKMEKLEQAALRRTNGTHVL